MSLIDTPSYVRKPITIHMEKSYIHILVLVLVRTYPVEKRQILKSLNEKFFYILYLEEATVLECRIRHRLMKNEIGNSRSDCRLIFKWSDGTRLACILSTPFLSLENASTSLSTCVCVRERSDKILEKFVRLSSPLQRNTNTKAYHFFSVGSLAFPIVHKYLCCRPECHLKPLFRKRHRWWVKKFSVRHCHRSTILFWLLGKQLR